ncbi:uncharacterized protein EI90DRAFT_3062886 [Cantharellus anzutake]|uniref:uncharacterized protein n=1 Tax=Cantharellus anzutake TaxID=1750568 RepID=UPI0019080389|nr:uncharacterized protein EI90DRAFT_3062886 [Cantharellus anzutake]KAF8329524.1 hypothetical protein EI90DRAFT_3062886 [Cantharellus anzutake]
MYGFPWNEQHSGLERQSQCMREQYDRKVEYHRKVNVPIWNGEFGLLYSPPYHGDAGKKPIYGGITLSKTSSPSMSRKG